MGGTFETSRSDVLRQHPSPQFVTYGKLGWWNIRRGEYVRIFFTNSGNFRIILSSLGKTRRALIDSSNHGLLAGGWIGKHFLTKSSKTE